MNWPSKGRYQAELDHFHVCDLQSRPYSGLCSDTRKQSDAPFHSDAPSTLPNHFIRAFQDLQTLFVCLCVCVCVCEDNSGDVCAPMNNKLNPENERVDGKQVEDESEHLARWDRLTL